MPRPDDFPDKIVRVLADRVNCRCSNPKCRKPTSGPHQDPSKRITIGIAAHICAASPRGPRYDPLMTSKERKSPDNGIWLCSDCAKLIDTDETKFPIELLRNWKQIAESNAEKELGIPQPDKNAKILQEMALQFDSEIQLHISAFFGRKWLFYEIQKWMNDASAQRWYLITGPPGVGKTAIAAKLISDNMATTAYYFCSFSRPNTSEPHNLCITLAHQISELIPQYAQLLLQFDIRQILRNGRNNPVDLFRRLIIDPLREVGPQHNPLLILIDALDEATQGGKNGILKLLVRIWDETPRWLRLCIICRPESAIIEGLSRLIPHQIIAESSNNLSDLKGFLLCETKRLYSEGKISQNPIPEKIIKYILERSEGSFLYVKFIIEEIENGRINLGDHNPFPLGIAETFERYFDKQFPNYDSFNNNQRPVFEILLAAKVPLPEEVFDRCLVWNGSRRQAKMFLEPIGALLKKDENGFFSFFHKSFSDWLTGEDTPVKYAIDPVQGLTYLKEYKWLQEKEREFMKEICKIKGTWIPQHPHIKYDTFGFELKNGQIAVLNLSIREDTPLSIDDDDDNDYSDEVCIEQIPASIGNLTALKELYLEGNDLKILPDTIGNLHTLEHLSLDFNLIDLLPNNFRNLTSLRYLSLCENCLREFSLVICDLQSIEELDLISCSIVSLPPEIGKLKSLQILHLEENNLNSLPAEISGLESLKILELFKNELETLPDSLCGLKSLQMLDLGENNLTQLPVNIGLLKELTNLELEDNKLSSIPESIGNLQSLITLLLDINELQKIPENIGKLHSLKTLDLSGNELIIIPEAIGGLENLEELNLSFNQLTNIPSAIEKLTDLKKLNLRNNHLACLPDSITNLTSLETLDLRDNEFVKTFVKLERQLDLWGYQAFCVKDVKKIIKKIRGTGCEVLQ